VWLGATTTIEDTGLLDTLQQAFRTAHPRFTIAPITGGTGEVLQIAQRGDLAVTLTHDPAAESVYVANGQASGRHEIMYNYFVVVGPAADPAHIHGLPDGVSAFRKIGAGGAAFVSRADQSGTHRKELELWRLAGLNVPTEKPAWYIEAGVGMGDALRLASARAAYILTEPGTFLTLQRELSLSVQVEGDERLKNRYAVMRWPRGQNAQAADSFVVWLQGPGGQQVIREFGRSRFNRPLFFPAPRD
jgi:tungstate transport system substrate-binding protein